MKSYKDILNSIIALENNPNKSFVENMNTRIAECKNQGGVIIDQFTVVPTRRGFWKACHLLNGWGTFVSTDEFLPKDEEKPTLEDIKDALREIKGVYATRIAEINKYLNSND